MKYKCLFDHNAIFKADFYLRACWDFGLLGENLQFFD